MKQSLLKSNKEIESKIYFVRSLKVMLDNDLAELYGAETRVLNQAVTRNTGRFPEDFMFQLRRRMEKPEITKYDFIRLGRSS